MKNFNFQSFISQTQSWSSEHVLVESNLIQLIVLSVTFFLAWMIAKPLRNQHRLWIENKGNILLPGTLRNATNLLILPALWLLMLWSITVLTGRAGWPDSILTIGANLLSAWVVIRLSATLMRNPFLTKSVAIFAWTIAALNILDLMTPTFTVLDGLSFNIGALDLSILLILKGLIYFSVFLWAALLISRLIENNLKSSVSLSPSMKVLTGKLVRITLVTAAFLIAISTVGIDLSIFTFFGGALGVGLGFGLQKVVSNFTSGIILLLDKSIKPGDVISIGETYGWVNSLNARYVSLDTRDGIEHLIPNEELIVNRVENWSHSHSRVRLKIPIGVHYDSDLKLAIELCEESAKKVERVIEAPPPVCLLVSFGDNSVNLEIRAWISDPHNGVSNIKSQILLKVWENFHENDIEIPYPQRDLHIKNPIEIRQSSVLAKEVSKSKE
ncbi:MAG: small-conductance mechanosensitive channel [Gammaproteobacteria bacterium]|jgi:small-conductance mechanosensitive channel